MNKILAATLGILFIFFMTTAGSALAFLFRRKLNTHFQEFFMGLASGVMVAASVWSLLIPALESDTAPLPSYVVAVLGFLLGGGFLYLLDRLIPHLHPASGVSEGRQSGLGRSSKLFLAVTLHNIPEGLSVGLAFGLAFIGEPETGALVGAMGLALGIGVQNFPEGAALALPIKEEKQSALAGFLYGTASGAVEPLAAVFGLFLATVLTPVMPWALSFAAGAMIYVVIDELIPGMSGEDTHWLAFGSMLGFAIMMVLDVAFG